MAVWGLHAAAARYRYGEDGGEREAGFHGRFFHRSDAAVLGRIAEAHRFADWVELVEVRWHGGGAGGGGARPGAAPPGRTAPMVRPGPGGGGRRHPRCPAFAPARLEAAAGGGAAALDCVVLDASPDGASVCLVGRAALPDLVVLALPGGARRLMRRRWQRGARAGLEDAGAAAP